MKIIDQHLVKCRENYNSYAPSFQAESAKYSNHQSSQGESHAQNLTRQNKDQNVIHHESSHQVREEKEDIIHVKVAPDFDDQSERREGTDKGHKISGKGSEINTRLNQLESGGINGFRQEQGSLNSFRQLEKNLTSSYEDQKIKFDCRDVPDQEIVSKKEAGLNIFRAFESEGKSWSRNDQEEQKSQLKNALSSEECKKLGEQVRPIETAEVPRIISDLFQDNEHRYLRKGAQGFVYVFKQKGSQEMRVLKTYFKKSEAMAEFLREAEVLDALKIYRSNAKASLTIEDYFGIVSKAGIASLKSFKDYLKERGRRLSQAQLRCCK